MHAPNSDLYNHAIVVCWSHAIHYRLSIIKCACFIRQQTILPITKQGGEEAKLGWEGGGGGIEINMWL